MRLSIDGNIAAGKSTLFSSIASRPYIRQNASLFPEPLDEWGDILDLYFKDRDTWALPLTLDILRGFHKPYSTPHAIIERNPYTCRYVFTEILRNEGVLTSDDMTLVDQYMDMFGWKPDAVIYIDVPPGECHDRLGKRNRRGEPESVTYDDLKMISYKYEKLFVDHLGDIEVHRIQQRPDETSDQFLERSTRLIEHVLVSHGTRET